MKFSKMFTKTQKEAPRGEVSKNAQLLIRAGFVNKEMAGVYSYLPLGLRVLDKIENIIREEMNNIGGEEVLLTVLQDPGVWKSSGRWDDNVVNNWFKTKLNNDTEIGLASTHEEPLCELLKQHIRSHNDIPRYIYQIQTKFRNELRAKSGLMRGREFLMKDLYSFNFGDEDFREFYEKCADAYMKIFKRVGLERFVFRTFASGGSFSKFSDEFQAVSSAGEDTIYIDEKKKIAINKEVYTDDILDDLKLDKSKFKEAKAIEVGNIFPLGTKFPKSIGLKYQDENGEEKYPIMGSYGIGLGRLMGAVVEILSDKDGIVWPESISPYKYHLISLGQDKDIVKMADEVYDTLVKNKVEVLYDDSNKTAGAKFADADLMGISKQIIIGKKTVDNGGTLEVKNRKDGSVENLLVKDIK